MHDVNKFRKWLPTCSKTYFVFPFALYERKKKKIYRDIFILFPTGSKRISDIKGRTLDRGNRECGAGWNILTKVGRSNRWKEGSAYVELQNLNSSTDIDLVTKPRGWGAEQLARMARSEVHTLLWWKNLKEICPCGPRRRWEDNIKMDIQE